MNTATTPRCKKVGGMTGLVHGNSGFTLLELILATLISALVMGIMSVALTFSLGTWQREQHRPHSDVPALLDLLKWQLACFDPVMVSHDGQSSIVFRGDEKSLSLATDYSVRALSRGVPVIARYIFVPGEKRVYYAEIPFDPYHPDRIKEFLEMQPTDDDKAWPRFYPTEVDGFAFTFVGQIKDNRENSWLETAALPSAVVANWKGGNESVPNVFVAVPSFMFSRMVQDPVGTGQGSQGTLEKLKLRQQGG